MPYFMLGAAVCGIDQYFKKKIEADTGLQDKEIAGGQIRLTRYHNRGAFLNLLENRGHLLLALVSALFGALLVICGLAIHRRDNRLLAFGLTLATGGAASNLCDRIRHGYVTDYFSFRKLPKIIFNLGDIAIFAGALLSIPAVLSKKQS